MYNVERIFCWRKKITNLILPKINCLGLSGCNRAMMFEKLWGPSTVSAANESSSTNHPKSDKKVEINFRTILLPSESTALGIKMFSKKFLMECAAFDIWPISSSSTWKSHWNFMKAFHVQKWWLTQKIFSRLLIKKYFYGPNFL
jgi:hypothetical protein